MVILVILVTDYVDADADANADTAIYILRPSKHQCFAKNPQHFFIKKKCGGQELFQNFQQIYETNEKKLTLAAQGGGSRETNLCQHQECSDC